MTHPHAVPPAFLRSRRAALSVPPSGLALPAVAGATQLDTIHHCKAEDLLMSLPDGFIDLIVTSPPYDNLRTYKGFTWNFELIARKSYRVLKPGGVLVWVVGDATVNGSETLSSMRQAIYFVDTCGFNMWDTMIYQKDGEQAQRPPIRYGQRWEYMFVLSKGVPKNRFIICTPSTGKRVRATRRQKDGTLKPKWVGVGGGTIGNVWRFPTGGIGKTTTDNVSKEHSAAFPEELAQRHILTWSNPGDVVLDYFVGSGTTPKMARKNGRHYIGCDIAKEYVDLSNRRLAIPYTPMMPQMLTA